MFGICCFSDGKDMLYFFYNKGVEYMLQIGASYDMIYKDLKATKAYSPQRIRRGGKDRQV